MSRYFYYLIVLDLIGSVISITPSFLFNASGRGALISILLALLIGSIFIYFITAFFNQFPGVGFPELLQLHTPKWISSPLLILFGLVWFTVGLKTLINYSFLLKRFLTFHLSMTWIALTLLLFISFSFFMRTKKLLFSLEIILLISLPVILLIVLMLYTNEGLEWVYIRKSIMYIAHKPSYHAFTAAFFVLLGATHLVIFNREFHKKQRMGAIQFLFVLLLATVALLTTYFIPIGYNGLDRIQNMSFPWLLTTDSIKVQLAFLERVMFIFLFLNLSIAFITIVMTWHVSMEMFKSIMPIQHLKLKHHNLASTLFTVFVWVVSLLSIKEISEPQFLTYSSYLYNGIPLFFLFFLILCWFISWRDKHASMVKK